MLLEAFLATDIAKRVLHGHAVRSYHAVRINVHDIYVVEGLYEVGACYDLAGFVEGQFWESELVVRIGGILAKDERAGKDDSCSLHLVSMKNIPASVGRLRKTSAAPQHRHPLCRLRSNTG
jgi:hypothetical protein